jgi:hypothetical protein
MSKRNINRNAPLLTILPPLKLSSLSRTIIKNIWLGIKSCNNWKRYVQSDVVHAFDPKRDMKNGGGISGPLAETIQDNRNSECRKITLNIPTNSGEKDKTIVVYIVWYPDSVPPNIDAMMRSIVAWFCFIVPFVRSGCECSDYTDVFLLLTSHDSVMPTSGEKLVSDNLFSAYTYTCLKYNEMYVMRQSVWLKALIHESFHTFGLDFSDASFDSAKSAIRTAFPGIANTVDIRLYESYTDIWATICYTLINIHFGKRTQHTRRQTSTPMATIERALHKQCCFAVLQSAKMLKHVNVSMESMLSRNKYTEDLMIFSYHVLRPLYMTDLNRFIEWTARHNDTQHYLRFRVDNVDSFASMLADIMNKRKWLGQHKRAGDVLNRLNPSDMLSNTAKLSFPMEL